MARLLDIAQTGLASVLIHRKRCLATACCVTAVLVPYLVGMGISMGLQRDAEISVRFGADLYVNATAFGRPVPVPLDAVETILNLDGVKTVVPRIVGPATLGRDGVDAVIVGVPVEHLPSTVRCARGRLFRKNHEFVIGSQLAKRLRLDVDDRVFPFYRSTQGERVARVVGVFQSGVALWESNIIFTSLETAAAIFDQPGHVSDLLVRCQPGYADAVRDHIYREVTFASLDKQTSLRPRIVTRTQLESYLPTGVQSRGGIFNLHFLLAFAVSIVAVLVTSGIGLSERQREISILKGIGWATDELLLRGLVESFLICVSSAAASVSIAYFWLRCLNGYWIAGVFLHGRGSGIDESVPFIMAPWPVLLALVVSFVVVMSGTLYSTWRAACTPPYSYLK